MLPIGDDEEFVCSEKAWDLGLVCIDLFARCLDRGILVRRILQLDHGQREAIDEDDDVRPSIVLAFDDRELVHDEPVVRFRMLEVDQLHRVIGDPAVVIRAPSPIGRGPG